MEMEVGGGWKLAMQKRPPPRRHNPGSPPDKEVAVQRRKPPEEEAAGPGHFGVQVSSQKNGAVGGARFPELTSRIYAGAGGSSATRPRKLVADEKKVTRPSIDIF